MIDQQIHGHPKEKCPWILEDFARPVLKHPKERVLHEVFGCVDAAQAASEKLLQIRRVIAD
mgnify:CR=1 FL=1